MTLGYSELFDSLQESFCPPLDTALLAALLADLETETRADDEAPSTPSGFPTAKQIDDLRAVLSVLSIQAKQAQDEPAVAMDVDDKNNDNKSNVVSSEGSEMTSNTPELLYTGNSTNTTASASTATTTTSTSDTSESHHHHHHHYYQQNQRRQQQQQQQHPFSSPLGFLQAALPHVSTKDLRSALRGASDGVDGGDTNMDMGMDMWDVVAGILSQEAIREMEERGVDGLDDAEIGGINEEEDVVERGGWETVERRRKKPGHDSHGNSTMKVGKKKGKGKGQTIVFGDVRQQRQLQPASPNRNINSAAPTQKRLRPRALSAPGTTATSDPWTRLTSLSSHLSTLLPTHPASFFQSHFHSPEYATPCEALRACLRVICEEGEREGGLGLDTESEEWVNTLVGLFDILLPSSFNTDSNPDHPHTLDAEMELRLVSDVEVALRATRGRGEDALDVVRLLKELDEDQDGEMGVYHSPVGGSQGKEDVWDVGASASGSTSRVSGAIASNTRTLVVGQKTSASGSDAYEWQTVPAHRRRLSTQDPHPLAAFIPAYANRARVNGGDSSISDRHKRKMKESLRKRDELLRQATKIWQRGSVKTRGGEVALYFAERAREFQEMAKKEGIMAARAMVESKRLASGDLYTIDLHGTTVAEATAIVKSTLEELTVTQSKPLKIITGRGAHSVNQVGVLKPAVKRFLEEEGWIVGSWQGGLDVRGRK